VVNLYNPFNVVARSVEINLPTDRKQGNGCATRTAAMGNLGKTGDADVPQWDKAPSPCNENTSLPHGGGNKAICKVYESIVENYPDIKTRKFNTCKW